ncbi:ribosome maturation factor RimM [Spiroplasma alleghenense]|uniref:Ribosome maturation factor RimM n=1 Tax=Spiroplasma alleghenense TaxID=216931 RepID=A0A345Z377_9MOLU|nr:ribosome maturation factor RimM [Spiroplasma alleghenense]AXK51056.1 16S rRNA processing protein RimM [Spiroplasma alleghenense]
MDIRNELIQVGKISTSHGIKGELKFKIDSNFIDNSNWDNATIFLSGSETQIIPAVVERSFYKNNHLIVKLYDYNSINEIQEILGKYVLIKKNNQLVSEVKNSINFKVYFEEKLFGEVIEELNNTAQKVLRVKYFNSDQSILVPMVERFVVDIDEVSQKIFLQNLKELL